jgi:hypothetical protein
MNTISPLRAVSLVALAVGAGAATDRALQPRIEIPVTATAAVSAAPLANVAVRRL